MKKKILIGILVSVVLINIYCIVTIGVEFIKRCNEPPFIATEDIVTQIFNENKDDFISAADELFKFKYNWILTPKSYLSDFYDFIDGLKYANLKNGVRILINDKASSGEMPLIKSAVGDNNSIEKIINKLRFVMIRNSFESDTESIYFFIDSDTGNTSGIIYCPAGEPHSLFNTKLKKLDDCWFYFERD